VGGAIALCGALSYGALGRALPESGGEYLYLSRTLHPLAGFLAGWISLLVGFTAPIAAAGLTLDAYWADAAGAPSRVWVGGAAIAAATLLHAVRRGAGVVTQNAAVALQLVLLGGLLLTGLPRLADAGGAVLGGWQRVTPGAFAHSLMWVGFAYSGWNAAVYVAGELHDPVRTLPRAMLGATLLVTALYTLLNAVLLGAAPDAAGRADIGAVAAEAIGGVPLRRAVSALVAVALWTSISSLLMAGPRVAARMAADGLLPRWLAARRQAPTAAVVLQAALALVVARWSTLATLLAGIGFVLGLSAAASVAAYAWQARAVLPAWLRAVALAFVIATLAASAGMVAQAPINAAVAVAVVAAGLPVYAFRR
jgi:APA family basic amino acid/polyamine antiporter